MDELATLNDLVASEIRAWIGRRQTTGRKLATKIGKSQSWVSTRTRGETEIAVNDLQLFADGLGIPLASLLPARDLNHRSGHPTESMTPRASTHPASSAVRTAPASTTRTTRRPTATTATGRTRRPAWQHG
jgi:transcriptional regulator with XRE-family HTH domain